MPALFPMRLSPHELGADAAHAWTRAISRWPAHADLFARKRDVDRAEACLIALAGLQREGRANG